VLRLFDLTAVEEVISRAGPRRGAGLLRSVLAGLEEPALTVNDMEERFLALCRSASVPRPEVNVWIDVDEGPAIKADFLWRSDGSSSKPTATPPTAHAKPSKAIACATSAFASPATRPCASPGASS
jgi:hypothetical protein